MRIPLLLTEIIINPPHHKRAIALLQSLLIKVYLATDSKALSATFPLVRKEGLAAYDAAHLELAIPWKLPLATFESRLAKVNESMAIVMKFNLALNGV
ncbi:MAG: hypothetical protein P5700_25210 [Arthrospira platensis PCC 7345]|uniref:hypothetical protein n=1 Tax=Limnospira platensis TaxID=118562 RepID=UPI0028E0F957|nr:hypothetical protein [Arthrospira platensis PCC 7345]